MARRSLRYSDHVIAAGALAALGIAVALVVVHGDLNSVQELKIFGAFALLVAASEMFDVTLPNNESFSLGIAPALGFALLGPILVLSHHKTLPEVLVMFTTGVAVATAMRVSMKKDLLLVSSAT